LVDKVIFVGAGGITLATTIIMEMAQPITLALTVVLQVSNLDNKETGSLLVLLFG
jgi:hypothetical protein